MTDETPDKKCQKWEADHCLVTLSIQIWGDVNHHCKQCISTMQVYDWQKGYVHIVFVPQVSISVLNALGVTLSVPKGGGNGVPMTCCVFVCVRNLCRNIIIVKKQFL